jgi:DNA helicase-2/ATP-dependent DNA helicase PcrA
MKDILSDLSPVQRSAVEQIDGASLIIAGAGSGKTRVLTYKIANMILRGVPPQSILALTFTNKAAREMKDRITKLVGNQANRLWMGTFHSIFSRILRAEAEILGFKSNYTIYDTSDSLSIIREIIKEMSLNDKIYKDRDVLNKISTAKNNMITPSAYMFGEDMARADVKEFKSKIAGIYQKYFMRCRNANAMDFDDLLLFTNILFRDHPAILLKYQEKFKYFLIDEYQDTNVTQYSIISRLAQKSQNITVVGDDAQSIYSFRGAKIENILNFKKDYQQHFQYKLEQNYRSTQTIVNAANSLIEKNKNRLQKTCFSEGDTGEKIDVVRTFSDQEEGQNIASIITDTVLIKRVYFSEIAILYRTNAQSRIFEDALRRKNIPYRIYGGISFYQRAEIKDIIAYMRLAVNPQDNEALNRIINCPARGIGNNTMEKIQACALNNKLGLWETICRLPSIRTNIKDSILKKIADFKELMESFIIKANTENVYTFASDVIMRSGIMADLKSNKTPEGISRMENIQELLNGIKEFSKNPETRNSNASEYLQNVSLITDMDKDSAKDNNRVTLMTVHAAKGLEFNYIFIVGMEEGLFPGTMSIQSEQSLEEERRLFYVALTRAAIKVTISFAQSRFRWGNLESTLPSRFLREIDPAYMVDNSVTASIMAKETYMPNPFFKKIETNANLSTKSSYRSRNTKLDSNLVFDKDSFSLGMEVEHPRFGRGHIIEVDVDDPGAKARIDFHDGQIKTLILKFAKLKIIRTPGKEETDNE